MVEMLRVEYEEHGLGPRKLHRKYGYPRSSIENLIRVGKWRLGTLAADEQAGSDQVLVAGLRSETTLGPAGDAMPPLAGSGVLSGPPEPPPRAGFTAPAEATETSQETPLPEAPGWLPGKKKKGKGTADIVMFPGGRLPPPSRVETRVLPNPTVDERRKLRVTLGAMRAMMTVEQVAALDHHEAVLRRYSHLVEVYLEPDRFVNPEGLSEEDFAEKVVNTRSLALRLLLPTERDTLAGAIKTLTEMMQRTLLLKRAVAGLAGTKNTGLMAATVASMKDPLDEEVDPEQRRGTSLALLATGDLRKVQRAMELLDRHQHAHQDAPKPPVPEPIDDIFDVPIAASAEASLEPEVPR